jgi:hypothetical protein
MNKTDLVDLATIYIKLHDLNESDTKYLIRRLHSLQTEEQIMNFLLSGGSDVITEEFMGRSLSKDLGLDNASDYFVSKIWKYLFKEFTGKDWTPTKDFILSVVKDFGTGGTVAATAISVLLLTALIIKATKFIREKLIVKERKECQGLSGSNKELCEAKYALMAKRMELNVVRRGLTLCPQTKKEAICKHKLEVRANNIRVDITKKQSEIKDLMQKVRNKKQ